MIESLLLEQMVFPWMFDEIGALQPLKEAAHILAAKEDWPPLYDIERLGKNQVCCIIFVFDKIGPLVKAIILYIGKITTCEVSQKRCSCLTMNGLMIIMMCFLFMISGYLKDCVKQ